MENLLKKYIKFQWTEICQDCLDTLKNKMAIEPILVFLDWKKEFHVHVDVSFVMLGVVLMHPGERVDRPSYSLRQQEIIYKREELYHDRKRRVIYGIHSA